MSTDLYCWLLQKRPNWLLFFRHFLESMIDQMKGIRYTRFSIFVAIGFFIAACAQQPTTPGTTTNNQPVKCPWR
jgi:hypothetical protein